MTDNASDTTAAPEPEPTSLEEFFRANQATVTEDVLTREAREAGHSEEAIQAAWAAAKGQVQAPSQGRRAVRAILTAYGITFLILSAGMLLNARPVTGELMPNAGGGILILAISLVVVFGMSLLWMASRRAFWTIAAVVAVLSGLSTLAYSLAPLLYIVPAGIVLWLVWRPGSRDVGTHTRLAVLLAIPVLMLLVVAGTCLASGLPIPGGG